MDSAREPAASARTSLEKGLDLLRIIGMAPGGCRMATLVAESGIPRSSAIRLVGQLESAGFVERDSGRQLFHLGPAMRCFGDVARRRHTLTDLAGPVLVWLAERSSETTYLSVRHGLDSLCVACFDGLTPIRAVTLRVGERRPLGLGASSTAILAALDDADVREIIALNAERLSASDLPYDAKKAMTAVEAARADGIATHESWVDRGVCCFGVAVSDASGVPIGAISLSFVGDHVPEDDRREYRRLMQEARVRLERRLGAEEGRAFGDQPGSPGVQLPPRRREADAARSAGLPVWGA